MIINLSEASQKHHNTQLLLCVRSHAHIHLRLVGFRVWQRKREGNNSNKQRVRETEIRCMRQIRVIV